MLTFAPLCSFDCEKRNANEKTSGEIVAPTGTIPRFPFKFISHFRSAKSARETQEKSGEYKTFFYIEKNAEWK